MTTSRRAFWLTLAALFAVAPLAWFGMWQPAQAWKKAQLATLADTQQRSAALSRRLEGLRREATVLSKTTQFDGLWSASSPGEATARVQAKLSDLARQNGITFRAITPLRTEAIPLKEGLAFRIEAEAQLDQLVAFLRDAEYSSPVLVFEKGSLRRLSRVGAPSEQPTVFFQFDVLAAYDIAEAE